MLYRFHFLCMNEVYLSILFLKLLKISYQIKRDLNNVKTGYKSIISRFIYFYSKNAQNIICKIIYSKNTKNQNL